MWGQEREKGTYEDGRDLAEDIDDFAGGGALFDYGGHGGLLIAGQLEDEGGGMFGVYATVRGRRTVGISGTQIL